MHSLQAHMLCKLILEIKAHDHMGLLTWVDPLIRLFNISVFSLAYNDDIIYAPITTGPGFAFSSTPRHRSAIGPY